MKRLTLIFALSLLTLVSFAQTAGNDSLIPGSQRDDFVKVSLLIASPGKSIYSVFGHCALRLQCPSQHLDYVYTFETESGLAGYLKFFAGQARAGFAAITPEEYLTPYRREGRGVVAYLINLTPHEKQELWRTLDEDMEQGPHRKYNLLKNQCLSMSILMIEQTLEQDNEFLDLKLPSIMKTYTNGEGILYLSKEYKWAQFLFMTFLGAEADGFWDQEYRLSPKVMPYVLSHSHIVSIDRTNQRPVLKGSPRMLLPATLHPQPSPVSPTLVFCLLLLFTLVITLLQWRGHCGKIAHGFDVILFALQSLAGLFLLYVTLVTGLFGLHWNWYLIPFNPLPLLLWLLLRRKPWYGRLYRLYAMVLAVDIPLFFLVTIQMDVPHALVMATLAIRTGYKGCLERPNSVIPSCHPRGDCHKLQQKYMFTKDL